MKSWKNALFVACLASSMFTFGLAGPHHSSGRGRQRDQQNPCAFVDEVSVAAFLLQVMRGRALSGVHRVLEEALRCKRTVNDVQHQVNLALSACGLNDEDSLGIDINELFSEVDHMQMQCPNRRTTTEAIDTTTTDASDELMSDTPFQG